MSDAAAPKWQQVLGDLEQRIARGDISGRFPTDQELVDRYGVSRHTVREAVRRLCARGLVERHRGRGSFVREPELTQPAGTLYSLFRSVEALGLEQRSEVLVLDERTDPHAAAALGLPADEPLVHLARLRHAGNAPLATDTAWLPAAIARPLLEADFRRTALYDELERACGLRITGGDELIEARVPNAECRATLKLDAGEAVFRIERRGLSDDRPVEWRVTIIRGSRFALASQWTPLDDRALLEAQAVG